MEFVTFHESELTMRLLEQCPIWGMYTEDLSDEVMIALDRASAVDYAYGPYRISADYRFAGGYECEGYVVVMVLRIEPHTVQIWTGRTFWAFARFFESNYPYDIDQINRLTGNNFTFDEVFPISYQLKLSQRYLDDIGVDVDIPITGTYE